MFVTFPLHIRGFVTNFSGPRHTSFEAVAQAGAAGHRNSPLKGRERVGAVEEPERGEPAGPIGARPPPRRGTPRRSRAAIVRRGQVHLVAHGPGPPRRIQNADDPAAAGDLEADRLAHAPRARPAPAAVSSIATGTDASGHLGDRLEAVTGSSHSSIPTGSSIRRVASASPTTTRRWRRAGSPCPGPPRRGPRRGGPASSPIPTFSLTRRTRPTRAAAAARAAPVGPRGDRRVDLDLGRRRRAEQRQTGWPARRPARSHRARSTAARAWGRTAGAERRGSLAQPRVPSARAPAILERGAGVVDRDAVVGLAAAPPRRTRRRRREPISRTSRSRACRRSRGRSHRARAGAPLPNSISTLHRLSNSPADRSRQNASWSIPLRQRPVQRGSVGAVATVRTTCAASGSVSQESNSHGRSGPNSQVTGART